MNERPHRFTAKVLPQEGSFSVIRSIVFCIVAVCVVSPTLHAQGIDSISGSKRSIGVVAMRSARAELPESLARESLAAADRAIDALSERVAEDDPRLLACRVAISGGDDAEAAESAARVARLLATRPWSRADAAKAAFAAFATAAAAQPLPESLFERLPRAVESGWLSAGESVLALLALDMDACAAPREAEPASAARWDKLAERKLGDIPDAASVAARAIARAARARARGSFGAAPGPDVLAHIRWISARVFNDGDGQGAQSSTLGVNSEGAFLATLAASEVPRAMIDVQPLDWRTRIATALVCSQISDGNGARWSGADDAEATAFAVLAIAILAL